MRVHSRAFAGAVALAVSISAASAAQASYFVRPYVQLGQGVVDGYVADGVTQRSVNFTSDLQSHVDLGTGTVKNYLKVNGPDAGGSGFGQAVGVLGDRLTFTSAGPSTVDFSFAFDGNITSPARDPNLNQTLNIVVFADLRVFDPSAGATYQNFRGRAGALVSDSFYLDLTNPETDLNRAIDEILSGSLTVDGTQTFDVFANLSMFTSVNGNPVTVEFDFMNTGRFGIQTAPGVSFTSASGVFLTGGSAVPEPATWAMLIVGFGAVGSALRRRATIRTVTA